VLHALGHGHALRRAVEAGRQRGQRVHHRRWHEQLAAREPLQRLPGRDPLAGAVLAARVRIGSCAGRRLGQEVTRVEA
jgi:hypothetical protein